MSGVGPRESDIKAALKEQGFKPSASLMAPPDLPDHFRVYWTAFIDLLGEPRGSNGMIPWTAIQQYASQDTIRTPVDLLKTVVWNLDYQLKLWWKANPPEANE